MYVSYLLVHLCRCELLQPSLHLRRARLSERQVLVFSLSHKDIKEKNLNCLTQPHVHNDSPEHDVARTDHLDYLPVPLGLKRVTNIDRVTHTYIYIHTHTHTHTRLLLRGPWLWHLPFTVQNKEGADFMLESSRLLFSHSFMVPYETYELQRSNTQKTSHYISGTKNIEIFRDSGLDGADEVQFEDFLTLVNNSQTVTFHRQVK